MKGMKIGQILMMCCLVMSSAVMMYTNTAGELDEGEAPSHHTHGSDWTTTTGEIEVVILTDMQGLGAIAWNPVTQVYDLAYTSERLRVEVQATGLEPNRNFFIAWQLFGYVDGGWG